MLTYEKVTEMDDRNTGLVLGEKLIFERTSPGRKGVEPVRCDVDEADPAATLPEDAVRDDIPGFPEVSEMDVARHFTKLSTWNFGVDTGFYPLGSCTMKYNPKVNESVAALPGFTRLHPYQPESLSQGALQAMYDLERALAEISGMDAVTLQPAAGAQGELCGLLVIAAYFRKKGIKKKKIIIPDTAHGTNPASSALGGFEVVPVESGPDGVLTPEAVSKVMDEETAALMLTNPNTLGLFEKHIKEIAEIVHDRGGLVYCDGANLNALMGLAGLEYMGVDVVQLNLHKTFSTPHGGGGPGSGPVGVTDELEPFLPGPKVVKDGDTYRLDYDRPDSIGRLKAFYGHFSVMIKALAYIRRMGGEGLKRVAEASILNANFIKENLKGEFDLPYDQPCMHECVFTDKRQQEHGVSTMDIAKRLIDHGVHPPTVYFPLVVQNAMMAEPTETESIESLEYFVEVMKKIAREAEEDPEKVTSAPVNTRIGRVDETRAARKPILRWTPEGTEE